MSELEFVTFCCQEPSLKTDTGQSALKQELALLPILLRSILKHHTTAPLTVITNASDEVRENVPGTHIQPIEIAAGRLMYERTKAYADYIRAKQSSFEVTVFLDTDCMLVAPLSEMTTRPFDLALTCIRYGFRAPPRLDSLGQLILDHAPSVPTSPINGGVIFSRTTDAACRMWDAVVTAYEDIIDMGESFYVERPHLRGQSTQTVDQWGGDQFALMNVFAPALIPAFPETTIVDGAKIAFLDVWEYNASPQIQEAGLVFNPDVKPRIVHMKGPRRKSLMPRLAQHFGI